MRSEHEKVAALCRDARQPRIFRDNMGMSMFDTEDELYLTIGSNIKYYRLKKGFTQSDFAHECGISTSYLSKIEAPHCNKSIPVFLLNDIANTLDVDIAQFFVKRQLFIEKSPNRSKL